MLQQIGEIIAASPDIDSDRKLMLIKFLELIARDSCKLDALETAGVDKWIGYKFAMAELNSEEIIHD